MTAPNKATNIHPVLAEMLDAELSIGNTIQFKVVSNSMKPLILRGDYVIAQKEKLSEIRRGDLVLIQRQSDFLTHRLILKSSNKWFTKGDNNLAPDTPSKSDVIIGRILLVRGDDQETDLSGHKWQIINPIIATLGRLEWKAFSIQRYFRLPFRLGIKFIQKFFMPKRNIHVDS